MNIFKTGLGKLLLVSIIVLVLPVIVIIFNTNDTLPITKDFVLHKFPITFALAWILLFIKLN